MYGQRRGLAHAQQQSDDQARNTNLTLMQQKRKRQLEEQLQEKLELQRQYSNPRGIGMRGQTVPARDMELLNEQIENIKRQIAEMNGTPYTPSGVGADPYAAIPPSPSSATSVAPSNVTGQSLATPSGGNFVPTYGGASTAGVRTAGMPVAAQRAPAPANAGSRPASRREQVWNAKYQQWLARERDAASRLSSRGSLMSNVPMGAGYNGVPPSLHGGFGISPQTPPVPPQPPTTATLAALQQQQQQKQQMPLQQQQQQYQQQEVRHGRRATPPTEATRPAVVALSSNQPQVYTQQWQQHQMQHSSSSTAAGPASGAASTASQAPSSAARYGRRAQQSSGLW